jgi:hypothetical protein
VICPICQRLDKKSQVKAGPGSTTLIGYTPYWDEGGRFHDHDPNLRSTVYHCTLGHGFEIRTQTPCPEYPDNCDFEGEEETFEKAGGDGYSWVATPHVNETTTIP